jgi:hypothetical protein
MLAKTDPSFIFIVGSPRSGTTLLGEILDQHPDISQWYEPNFVWDRHFRDYPHDERTFDDATPNIRRQIYSDFVTYKRRMGSNIILDKSPRNSLRVPFILSIFPHARFIYITRDGRDVTLSINKEWIRRRQIVSDPGNVNRFDYRKAYRVLKQCLKRQPSITYKLRALWFETHGHVFKRSLHVNRLRWHPWIGWGPRFRHWQDVLPRSSLLQFNAYQWAKCVDSIQDSWHGIPHHNKLMIRYEDILQHGQKVIIKILDFLSLRSHEDFLRSLPELKRHNYGKWKNAFSQQQISEIHPILTPMLMELGYEDNPNWQ